MQFYHVFNVDSNLYFMQCTTAFILYWSSSFTMLLCLRVSHRRSCFFLLHDASLRVWISVVLLNNPDSVHAHALKVAGLTPHIWYVGLVQGVTRLFVLVLGF